MDKTLIAVIVSEIKKNNHGMNQPEIMSYLALSIIDFIKIKIDTPCSKVKLINFFNNIMCKEEYVTNTYKLNDSLNDNQKTELNPVFPYIRNKASEICTGVRLGDDFRPIFDKVDISLLNKMGNYFSGAGKYFLHNIKSINNNILAEIIKNYNYENLSDDEKNKLNSFAKNEKQSFRFLAYSLIEAFKTYHKFDENNKKPLQCTNLIPIIKNDLENIEVHPPLIVTYYEGDNLNLMGLKVYALYSDGSKKIVTDYTANPGNGTPLNTIGQNTIVIQYSEDGITKTNNFTVTVSKKELPPPDEFHKAIEELKCQQKLVQKR